MGSDEMRIAVIGCGIMGRAAVLDLADDEISPDVEAILVGDLDERKVKRVSSEARKLTGSKDVHFGVLDARDRERVSQVLESFDADVVLNAALYDTIPSVMRAALDSGISYVDLGDDVETLRWQRSLEGAFMDRGIAALVEMGGSPGLINVMASLAVRELERVERITLREGWIDLNDYDSLGIPLPVPYSLETIFDELEQPAEVWDDGRIRLVEPFSGLEEVNFPDPVGRQEVYYVEHPEVYSLAMTFKDRGVRFVDYKLSFPRDLLLKYKLLHDLGLTKTESVELDGVEIVPRRLVAELVRRSLEGVEVRPNDYDVMIAKASGWRGDLGVEAVVVAKIRWSERWNASAQALLVGSPASLAAQWLALGLIQEPGVHYPEEVVEPIPFLREMETRGMEFRLRVTLSA